MVAGLVLGSLIPNLNDWLDTVKIGSVSLPIALGLLALFILLGLLVLFPKAKFTEKVLHKAEPKLPRVVAFPRRLGIGTEAEG